MSGYLRSATQEESSSGSRKEDARAAQRSRPQGGTGRGRSSRGGSDSPGSRRGWALALECDQCGRYYSLPAPVDGPINCPGCGLKAGTIEATWSLAGGCPVCGARHLYRRKDFNQLVGLLIVILGAVLGILISYWFLAATAVLDAMLYRWVSEVAVCYRCGAELRGLAAIGGLKRFEHHTAEIYAYRPSVATEQTNVASRRGGR